MQKVVQFGWVLVLVGLWLPGLAMAGQTLIQAISVVDVATGEVNANQDVLIEDGVISGLGPLGSLEVDSEALKVDGRGLFVIPGLTEMHAHVMSKQPDRDWALTLYVINGITTARGMLGQPEHLQLRADLEAQRVIGPRLITSGPSMNGNSVTSPEQAETSVREQKAAGYDFLKIHPGMNDESFTRLTDTANEVGMPFAGHVTAATGLLRSLELRQGSVDHLDGFLSEWARMSGLEVADPGFFGISFVDRLDTAQMDKLVQRVKPFSFVAVPTESLMVQILADKSAEFLHSMPGMEFVPQVMLAGWQQSRDDYHKQLGISPDQVDQFLELRRKLTKALFDAGIPIALGSDAPQIYQVPGYSLHHEMELMVEAGLSNLEVLQAGSLIPAAYFGESDSWGQIKKGFAADLVLLRSDPLQDISHARDIHSVFVRGRWLSPEWIVEQKQLLQRP